MPWVIFEATTGWGCGKDQSTDEYRVKVHGAAEAEELAERLREYGRRPHRIPESGDKDILMIGESVVHEGLVFYVRVEDEPYSDKVGWDSYDSYMNKCLF